MHAINRIYSSHVASILRTIVKRYVDDAFNLLVEFPTHGVCIPQPAQGVVVDTTTYTWGIHQIDIPPHKVQFYLNGEEQEIVLPTKEQRVAHLGQLWATDTPEQRGAAERSSRSGGGNTKFRPRTR